MIRKYGYKTEEQAKEAAKNLLWESKKDDTLRTTSTRRKDIDGAFIPFFSIKDDDTGALVCICRMPSETYNVIYLTEEEAKKENRTYPYRDINEDMIPFLMAVNTPIFKPVRPVGIAEALIPEGVSYVNTFFGIEPNRGDFLTEEQLQAKELSVDEAFEEWEDEEGNVEITALRLAPYPVVLASRTKVLVSNASDYVKAMANLLNTKFSKEQEEAVRNTYLFNTSSTFLRYAIYEFFRTEDYNHLKEILSQYDSVGLPKDWERETYLLRDDETAEAYALAKYIAKRGSLIIGDTNRAKEIAEYINAPFPVVYKASKIMYINDF